MENKYIGDYKPVEIMVNVGDRIAFRSIEDILADEKNEESRRSTIEMSKILIRIDDQKVYFMNPLPEGVTLDDPEVKKAVESGAIKIVDGMIADDQEYELRKDGVYMVMPGGGKKSRLNTDNEGELIFFVTKYRKIN
ncbi:MAG: hypothetical protein MJZ15_00845 [Bacteroidales bacterium]|nr:hypothetical protein [Bacteroidales bacterium]